MRRRSWILGLCAAVVALAFAADTWAGKPGGGGGGGGDPSRIAFNGWSSGTGSGIFTTSASGAGTVQVATMANESGGSPRWSSDGRLIAYLDGWTLLRIVRVSDGAQLYAYDDMRAVRWSQHRDGSGALLPAEDQLLAYSNWVNIRVRKPDGTTTPVLLTAYGTTGTLRESARDPFWLPDDASGNARLAYLKFEEDVTVPSDPVLLGFEVRVLTLDTSSWPAVSVLSDDLIPGAPTSAQGLVWSRDATKVGWPNGNGPGFYIAPVTETGGALTIAWTSAVLVAGTGSGTRLMTFSPDATKIAFTDIKRPVANSYYLYVIGTDNSGLKKVSGNLTSTFMDPDWGP